MKKNKKSIESLSTPIIILDMDKLEKNIKEMTHLSADVGIKLRPHTKVHESPYIAKLQIDAGACGIEVGTVERAKCMIDAGIFDIVIAHPFYDEQKVEMVREYLSNPKLKITFVVDMIEQAMQFNEIGKQLNKKIPLLLKIALSDNYVRFGISSGKPALELSKKIVQLPYIQFKGIYAHESGVEPSEEGVNKSAFESASIMEKMSKLLKKEGINVEHVSVGASSTFRATCNYLKEKKFTEITEIHPGNCVIGDVWHTKNLGNKREDCAVTVLSTVMSTSHLDYFVIDAGYKTFGKDPLIEYSTIQGFFWKGKPSFGHIKGRTDLWLGSLGAETACVYYRDYNIAKEKRLEIGERLEIIPNNSTLAISLNSKMYGVRDGILEKIITLRN